MTKILFIDADEISFQIRKCIAKALAALPEVELFQAHDANEGLQMIESVRPDVVVFDHEELEEQQLFIDSLTPEHPPVVLQTNTTLDKTLHQKQVTCIPKSDSLDGIHQALLIAAAIGSRTTAPVLNKASLH